MKQKKTLISLSCIVSITMQLISPVFAATYSVDDYDGVGTAIPEKTEGDLLKAEEVNAITGVLRGIEHDDADTAWDNGVEGTTDDTLNVKYDVTSTGTICDSNGCIADSQWDDISSPTGIEYTGGDVGIGLENGDKPLGKLHLHKGVSSKPPLVISKGSYLWDPDTSTYDVVVGDGNDYWGIDAGTDFGIGSRSDTDLLYITSAGNVGIGTTSPVAKLDINGSVKFGDDTDVCDITKAGTIRYNTENYLELCNGTAWVGVGEGGGSCTTDTDIKRIICSGELTCDCPVGYNVVAGGCKGNSLAGTRAEGNGWKCSGTSITKSEAMCMKVETTCTGGVGGSGMGITWLETPVEVLNDSTLGASYETIAIPQVPAGATAILKAHTRIKTDKDEIYLYLRKKGSLYNRPIFGLDYRRNYAADHAYNQVFVEVNEDSEIEYRVEGNATTDGLNITLELLGYISESSGVVGDGSTGEITSGSSCATITADDILENKVHTHSATTGGGGIGTVTLVDISGEAGYLVSGYIQGAFISGLTVTVDGTDLALGAVFSENENGDDTMAITLPLIQYSSSLKIVFTANEANDIVAGYAVTKENDGSCSSVADGGGSSSTLPTCTDGDFLKKDNGIWECMTCADGEGIVKNATGWECKSQSLFGKEKYDLSNATVLYNYYTGSLSNLWDGNDATYIESDQTEIVSSAPTPGHSGACDVTVAAVHSSTVHENTIPQWNIRKYDRQVGHLILDLGAGYETKFGNFIMSGDIIATGGGGCACGATNSGSAKVFVDSSSDNVNYTNQGVVTDSVSVAGGNSFLLTGNFTGRYVKIYTSRVSPFRCTGSVQMNLKINNLEIYTDL